MLMGFQCLDITFQMGSQAVSPTKYEICRILRLKAAMKSKIGLKMKNKPEHK